MIKLDNYTMGREKLYPLTKEQLENACDLLAAVHYLMGLLGIEEFKLSSGYRPSHYNKAAGGAARSGHLTCEAIDISDPGNEIGKKILERLDLLEKCGLYLEDISYTENWLHLQIRPTSRRVFRPY
jgi:hypothetical protein